ncbi:hypothetical protein OXPF_04810 [Oxobacter pfennigii]|uniref:DUF1657 domain-containing protein n=1 Tax=Oxobacter pfennigii TaxID=36849 RepID=A0A0P8WDK3_9CLOT|nr:DUF1657 domain-containing protein [Oxobacter pfennigii]KPU46001.1 hypothetical protein OXPF_04810 [Oxobacter pfennigii]
MTVASQLKQTIATLKGVESTLKVYRLQSQDEDTKSAYQEAIDTANEVINDLENRSKTLEFEEPQYKGY